MLTEILVDSPKMLVIGPPLTPAQIRGARAILTWTREQLAAESGVVAGTIKRVEEGKPAQLETMVKLRQALERQGFEFPDRKTMILPGED